MRRPRFYRTRVIGRFPRRDHWHLVSDIGNRKSKFRRSLYVWYFRKNLDRLLRLTVFIVQRSEKRPYRTCLTICRTRRQTAVVSREHEPRFRSFQETASLPCCVFNADAPTFTFPINHSKRVVRDGVRSPKACCVIMRFKGFAKRYPRI